MAVTTSSRHVRLFKNGRSQAVRIPREFELPGNEAILRREKSGRLILEPVKKVTLTELLSSWDPLRGADALPAIEDKPAEPVGLVDL
jgi:antitoxin VapB